MKQQTKQPKRPRDIVTKDDIIVAETYTWSNGFRAVYINEERLTDRTLARGIKWLSEAIAWRDWRGE